ncbi:hypothetical protein B7486_67945, partial [cyanobacterium TDX16]
MRDPEGRCPCPTPGRLPNRTPRADGPPTSSGGAPPGGLAPNLRAMPMRFDCKFFESRSYPNGETVHKCDIDLAPEAPWRCPTDCKGFVRRTDVAWSYGS